MISVARLFKLGTSFAVITAVAALTLGVVGTAGAAAMCSGAAEQPFLPWIDPAPYTLAPGGAFEGPTTAWKLAGGSKLSTGNEPFKVHQSTDGMSLALPAGGSATSPAQCVDLLSPTLRFFAVGGNAKSILKVDVIYQTALGTFTQPVTVILARSSWGPTTQALILANATGLFALDGLTSSVQFRFSAVGTAGWKIDDVYVDPWKTT